MRLRTTLTALDKIYKTLEMAKSNYFQLEKNHLKSTVNHIDKQQYRVLKQINDEPYIFSMNYEYRDFQRLQLEPRKTHKHTMEYKSDSNTMIW